MRCPLYWLLIGAVAAAATVAWASRKGSSAVVEEDAARARQFDQILGAPSLRPTFSQITGREAEALLDGGLVGLNVYQMRAGVPGIRAAIREGTVVYTPRDDNEHFKSIRDIWTLRDAQGRLSGDCEDLAAAVAAELTVHGEPAHVVLSPPEGGVAHAVVRVARTGQILDPSRDAGML